MKRKIKTVLVLIGAISMAFLPCMTAAPKADSRFTVLYNQEQMELPEDALITRNHVIMVSVADLAEKLGAGVYHDNQDCLLYTSPSPRDRTRSRMPSSA